MTNLTKPLQQCFDMALLRFLISILQIINFFTPPEFLFWLNSQIRNQLLATPLEKRGYRNVQSKPILEGFVWSHKSITALPYIFLPIFNYRNWLIFGKGAFLSFNFLIRQTKSYKFTKLNFCVVTLLDSIVYKY